MLLLVVTQLVFRHGTPVGVLFDGFVHGLVVGHGHRRHRARLPRPSASSTSPRRRSASSASEFFVLPVLTTPIPFPIVLSARGADLGAGRYRGRCRVSVRFLRSSRLVLTVITAVAAQFLVRFAPDIAKLSFFKDVELLPLALSGRCQAITDYLPFSGCRVLDRRLQRAVRLRPRLRLEVAVVVLLGIGAGAALHPHRRGRAGHGREPRAGRSARHQRARTWWSGVLAVAAVASAASPSASTGDAQRRPAQARGLAPTVLLAALLRRGARRGWRSSPPPSPPPSLLVIFARAFEYSYARTSRSISVLLPADARRRAPARAAATTASSRRGLVGGHRRAEARSQGAWSTSPWCATPASRLHRAGARRAAVLLPFLGSTGFVNLASTVALGAIVVVSLVVLTGWGGQVSLGQWGFAAVGAVVGRCAHRHGRRAVLDRRSHRRGGDRCGGHARRHPRPADHGPVPAAGHPGVRLRRPERVLRRAVLRLAAARRRHRAARRCSSSTSRTRRACTSCRSPACARHRGGRQPAPVPHRAHPHRPARERVQRAGVRRQRGAHQAARLLDLGCAGRLRRRRVRPPAARPRPAPATACCRRSRRSTPPSSVASPASSVRCWASPTSVAGVLPHRWACSRPSCRTAARS